MNRDKDQTIISEPLSSKYDTTISLLNVYFLEWSHRDQVLWAQTFRFYYAALIIILLPNLADPLLMNLPEMSNQPYRIIGLLISVVFLYVSLGYAVRLHTISISYRQILNSLPQEYKQKTLDDIEFKGINMEKLFKPRLGYIVCITLFLSLFVLAVLFIIFDAKCIK